MAALYERFRDDSKMVARLLEIIEKLALLHSEHLASLVLKREVFDIL